MKVQHILQAKGGDVYSVSVKARIAEAVEILNDRNIGAVLVTDGSSIAGILSERDIVRLLGRKGSSALDASVSECMTAKVETCSMETTVHELMEKMTERRIRHIPVVENGALAGVVSIGDVVKRKIEEAEQESSALREYIAS